MQSTDRRTLPLLLVGITPLVNLRRIAVLPPRVELYARAEWYSLGGSVKDRPALWMIRDGEQRGLLRPGMRIADATRGNTGAAANVVAALRVAQTLRQGVVVTIMCDSAARYLSERFWEEQDLFERGTGI